MRDFEYIEPKSVSEAVSALAKYRGKARLIAGGTDILITIKNGSASPDCLINIKTIPKLNNISHDQKQGFTIGPLTTLKAIETSPLINDKLPILAQAAHQIAAPRIRSVATIGGNLCQDTKCLYYAQFVQWQEPPCYRADGDVCYAVKGAKRCQAMAIADIAPALLCLNATASISGTKGDRTLPFADFFVGSGEVSLNQDEMLTAINIPDPPPQTTGFYLRHSLRGAPEFVIAAAAAVITVNDSTFTDVRIGLLGVNRTPIRAPEAEQLLIGNKIDDNLIEQAAQAAAKATRPLGDIFGSAAYRRKITPVLVRRALKQALQEVRK